MAKPTRRKDIDVKTLDSANVLPSLLGSLLLYGDEAKLHLNVTQSVPARNGEDTVVTYADEVLRQTTKVIAQKRHVMAVIKNCV